MPQAANVIEAMDTILAAAKRNGVIPGTHCANGQMAREMFDKGFQFCTLANDARLLSVSAQNEIKAARGGD